MMQLDWIIAMIQQTIYQSQQSQPHLFPLPESNQEEQENLTMNGSSSKWQKHGGFTLTERDIDILYALFKRKYMDTIQIQKFFWRATRGGQFGATKSCQRRLRQLEAYGMIRRIQQAVKRT